MFHTCTSTDDKKILNILCPLIKINYGVNTNMKSIIITVIN